MRDMGFVRHTPAHLQENLQAGTADPEEDLGQHPPRRWNSP